MADIEENTTPPEQEEATKPEEKTREEQEEPAAPAQDESTTEEPPTPQTEEQPVEEKPSAEEQPSGEPVQPTVEEQPQTNNNETEPEVTASNGGDKVESVVVIEAEEVKKRMTVPLSGRELKKLVIGMDLNKIKKGKLLGRYYSITEDLVRLTWNSKRKTILKAQIPLSQIQDVILGNNTGFTQYDSSCCFTLVYVDGGHDRTLDLMTSTSEQAELWVNGLLAIIGTGVTDDTNEHRKKWLRFLFDEADENGDGTLDLKEIIQMMKRLNVGVSNKIIKRKFKEADTSGNGDNKLDFDEFIQLFNEFSERPDIRRIFNLHASADNGTNMSVEDLLLFLKSVQNLEGADEDYCRGIIERFEPSEDGKNKNLLSLDGFTQYMLSHDNDIFKREHRQIYQDMSRPLSHYFIASSHNTYLEADQISGPSSIDCYIRALNDGCRCVELDCWDGDNDEPVIYHGHTLTSKILFKDVITAIKDNAFNSSDYPVILSIENHCSINQQFVMATYMSDIFGDMLFKNPRDPDRKELPSPAELRNKILVKAKKLPAELEDKSDNEGEVSDEDEAAEIDPEEIKKVRASSPPQKTPATETTPGEAAPSQATEGTTPEIIEVPPPPEVEPQPEQELRKVVDSGGTKASRRKSFNKKRPETVSKPKAKRKLSSKLSKCVNYVQSVHFKGFDEITNIPYYQMSSFGESSAFRYSDELANEFIEYNKTHLSRTYPAGKRIDSSNYEPIRLWNAGCQIVALNYQTAGKPMDWNMGKFQQNGGCGYILRPDIMNQDYSYFNHNDADSAFGVHPKVVTIRVISGQQLPKPEGGNERGEIIDPYVVVQFAGVKSDCAEFKTKVIHDNGFNPVWNEVISHVVTFPELAMVRFKVMDRDRLSQDDFIGQFTLPFDSLQTGYRHIHLRKSKWELVEEATIFVEVSIVDYIGPPSSKIKDKPRQIPIRRSRLYPSMKTCNYQQLDSLFRGLTGALRLAANLREDYTFYSLLLKDACGNPARSSIISCFFQILKVAQADGNQLKLVASRIKRDDVIYVIEIKEGSTQPKSSLARMITHFNQLNGHVASMINLSEPTVNELVTAFDQAIEKKNDFMTALGHMIAKKVVQAKFGYAYNVRTLKNEADRLTETMISASSMLSKISNVAKKLGVEVIEPPALETTTEETPATTEETPATTEDTPATTEETPATTTEETPATTEETPATTTEETPATTEETPATTTEETPATTTEETPATTEETPATTEDTPATTTEDTPATTTEDTPATTTEDTPATTEETPATTEETPANATDETVVEPTGDN